jgi:DNA polymerase-3 subunit delta'
VTGTPTERPAPRLFADVVGQAGAVAALTCAAREPVHAYLFHGATSSTRPAARAFAAALLCPTGGCGECEHCRRALAGTHPDLVTVERTGAALGADDARRLVGLAQRRPLESARQVLVVPEAHLAARTVPALLKTIEEPPRATVFILLAEDLPPELVTIVSRCVVVDFPPVASSAIVAWLEARGIDPVRAAIVAEGSAGDLERARLLADDPGYARRLELWRSIPSRLDGNGSVAAELARTLLESADSALEPLRRRHAGELEVMAEESRSMVDGPRALSERALPGRKEITERQHREERRWRTDEIRSGLGVLARAYRDRLADALGRPNPAGVAAAKGCEQATGLITEAAAALIRNPNERLMLESLLVRLGKLGA